MRLFLAFASRAFAIPSYPQEDESLQTLIERQTRLLEDAATRIDGSKNPAGVPLHLSMHWFLQTYGHEPERLEALLTSTDQETLGHAAVDEDEWLRTEDQLYIANFVAECWGSNNRDAIQSARSLDLLARYTEDRKNQWYQSILDSLSGSGREVIMKVLNEEVAPRVSYMLVNNVLIAEQDPELFRQMVRSECDIRLSGQPPRSPSSAPPGGGTPQAESSSGAQLEIVEATN